MKRKVRKVQVSLKDLRERAVPMVITAYVSPTICSSPPRAEPYVRCHAHLVRRELAEPVTFDGEDRSILILIGKTT